MGRYEGLTKMAETWHTVNFRYLPDYHDKCGKKKILHQKLNQSLREYLNGRIQILLNDLKAIFVLNVRIKAYYNLSVKI